MLRRGRTQFDPGVLDHRVRQQPFAHLLGDGPRIGFLSSEISRRMALPP